MSEPTGNPYDINGPHFNSDFYLQKLYRVSIYLGVLF